MMPTNGNSRVVGSLLGKPRQAPAPAPAPAPDNNMEIFKLLAASIEKLANATAHKTATEVTVQAPNVTVQSPPQVKTRYSFKITRDNNGRMAEIIAEPKP